MDWYQTSMVNFGLVWEGRRSPVEYTPDMFAPPFDKGIKILQRPKGKKEDVAKVVAWDEIQKAHLSVANMNGMGEPDNFDWKNELINAYVAYKRGVMLKGAGERLIRNEDVDIVPLYGELTSALANQSTGLTLASSINYEDYKPFMESGYSPIDTILGGIPSDGPIVVYGMTGVGKSHFSAQFTMNLLKRWKQKTGGIYTLEMSSEHYLQREIKMYPEIKEVLDRLYVSGSVRNIEQLVAEVTSQRLDFVVIDDMDGLVEDETTSAYLRVYKRIREICRFLKIPVMVLAQPNRVAKTGDRFLRPYDISWSGAGEDSAALLIALQKADLWLGDDIFPLDEEEKYYMIFWKSRDGWPKQMGPGAIRLENQTPGRLWSGTPFKNRLWVPQGGKNSSSGAKRKDKD